jgi:hypothetical protein
MPFNIATFRQYLHTANPTYSRLTSSSIQPLENRLAILGATVGPAVLNQIQPLWAVVPYDKQQKYAAPIGYLKQFVPTLADAIPALPRMAYMEFKVMFMTIGGNARYPARFYHVHRLTWQSSNGRMASLAQVGTRERVTHRTNPAGPPFDALINANIPMAFTQGALTNAGAQGGSNYDDHSTGNPALIVRRPLGVGSVIADQIYEYTADGATWHPIPGAQYEIEKGVRMAGGQHVFFFRKQSAPPHANVFHFEVEYPIGPAHPVPGNRIPVVPAGFAAPAQINTYASRIIRLG